MALPTTRDKTHTPGDPISSTLLDKLQDCVVHHSHGSIEIPLDLSQRIIPAGGGTWTIGSGGTLTEAANNSSCRVPIAIPTGTTITGIRVRGQQTGATDQFTTELQSATGVAAGANPIGSLGTSSSAITGTEQDVPVSENTTTVTNTRYHVRIGTTGGGAGNRIITGAFVTVTRQV